MVSFDEIEVCIADVVTVPKYPELLVFTILDARVDFIDNSKGDVILDVTSTDKGVTLVVSATTGYLVYNVVRNSVVFRTMYEGYPVVETVLNVFFNSPEAGEAGVGTDTEGLFVERVTDFSVVELGCTEYGGK